MSNKKGRGRTASINPFENRLYGHTLYARFSYNVRSTLISIAWAPCLSDGLISIARNGTSVKSP
jgi:hypothetical protein